MRRTWPDGGRLVVMAASVGHVTASVSTHDHSRLKSVIAARRRTLIGPQLNWRPIENEKMRSDIRKPDGKITTTTAIGQIRNKIAADSLDWKRQRRDFVRSEIYWTVDWFCISSNNGERATIQVHHFPSVKLRELADQTAILLLGIQLIVFFSLSANKIRLRLLLRNQVIRLIASYANNWRWRCFEQWI